MTWFKVDDGFYDHPKTADVSNAAIGLWTRAGSYSARYLTDGAVARNVVRSLGTTKQAAELVKAGLWIEDADGWRFHDWHDNNPTRAEVEERRAEDAERKRESRKTRSNSRRRPTAVRTDVPPGVQPDTTTESEQSPNGRPAGQPADVQPESSRARPHPDPTRPVVTEVTTARDARNPTASGQNGKGIDWADGPW